MTDERKDIEQEEWERWLAEEQAMRWVAEEQAMEEWYREAAEDFFHQGEK